MKLIEAGSPIKDPALVERMRVYRITTELHIPPPLQGDIPAVELDWLLKIHEAVVKRQNEALAGG